MNHPAGEAGGEGPSDRAARGAGVLLPAILAGCREPVVIVVLLISFFSAISGKPLDGLLMLLAGGGLARDAGQRRLASRADPAAQAAPAAPPGAAPGLRRSPRGRWLLIGTGLAGGALYAMVVGSFARYTWPATIAVIAVGVAVVARGWRGPVVGRPDPGPLPWAGTALWGGVLVAGGLWELAALLQQPSLTTSSYAHPTISTLTDPLLSGAGGRTAVLAAWLALGWALVRR